MEFDISKAWAAVQEMIDDFVELLPNLVLAALVFAAFLVVAGVVRVAVRNVAKRAGTSESASTVVSRLARWAVVAAGALVAVSIVASDVGAEELIALLGVGGIAIGFAFRDVLQNFLAGILILLQQPFRVGDQIGTSDGYEGTVEEIQTRATFLKTFDGRRVVIPNADLYTDAVEVHTAYPVRRSQYDVGIGYLDDFDVAAERIVEAVGGVDEVLDDPGPEAMPLFELGDSAVTIRARWWTASDQGSVTATRGKVIAAIKRALDAAGVDIPYPISTVLFHDETKRDETGASSEGGSAA